VDTTNRESIATLNALIETCKDGEQGFRTAADAIANPELKRLFTSFAEERARFTGELQAEVHRLGGDPERSGSVAGSLHRGWMNIKSAIAGKDDQTIIAEAERGEDSAKAAYERALASMLPTEVQTLVQRQFARVKAAHDRVRDLKRAA
jgi:uncharacterized protein (TIGR02284 family)